MLWLPCATFTVEKIRRTMAPVTYFLSAFSICLRVVFQSVATVFLAFLPCWRERDGSGEKVDTRHSQIRSAAFQTRAILFHVQHI